MPAVAPYYLYTTFQQPNNLVLNYIQWQSSAAWSVVTQPSFNRNNSVPVPEGGTITITVRIVAISDGTGGQDMGPGSSVLGLHRERNATPDDTDTQSVGWGPPGAEFSVSSSGWTKGDQMTLSWDPSGGTINNIYALSGFMTFS